MCLYEAEPGDRPRRGRRGLVGAEAPVGPSRERTENVPLVALEAVHGTFAGGAVQAHVGRAVHPRAPPGR